MRSLVLFLYLTISWVEAQNGRGPQHQDHIGHGWDIRLAVPGEPGNDYPTLGAIPRTTFSCAGREPGYYADLETNCQVFRVCTVGSTYGFQSFLCPNGTLFNQAVFVCDWWMNVDCQNSQQFFTNNDQKFENLRLGPQLMKDIKKMLTHPMRNPLEKSAMKSNLVVMQDYKPPSGQLFPNGALLAGPERPPNNVYVPSKLINQFGQNNLNDITFSASTPEPRYLSGQLNINPLLSQSNADAFQRQRQSGQYNIQGRTQSTQTLQSGNFISNGHAGRYVHNTGQSNNGISQLPRPTQNTFSQTQPDAILRTTDTTLSRNNQSGGLNRPRVQYTEPRKLSEPHGKQINFGSSVKSQKHNINNQNKQTLTPTSAFPQFSNVVDNTAGRELKQNLVSTTQDVTSTVATKVTTNTVRVQQPAKAMKTKPRITVKTWIVKPTKLARLIASPTPYAYPRPTQSPNDRLIDDTTPYVYDIPTGSSTEKVISVESETEPEEPYVYTKPTQLPKLISTETTRLSIAPTSSTIRSTFSERLNLLSSPSTPTNTRVYLTPPTFMANDRFYLPPLRNPTILSRQYLPPNIQPVYYESAQLKATPTMPSSTYVSYTLNSNKPTLSPSSSNNNNLTFTDVLTKEKLDITVNDIVKDTNDILRTASPAHYGGEFNSIDYIENDYLPTRTTMESGEHLTSQSPFKSRVSAKISRLMAAPSPDLQPPKETFANKNSNRLSELPFFKESSLPNTIERTVSIKITIPERIAAHFFNSNSNSDFDKLEILNTGSSNYLVLSNNLLTKNNGFNFIPIAKLNGDNSKNISNSQALVYSFLADSINVAREYNNIAKQEVLSSTPASSTFQNMNSEDLSQITNKVSQLTSSQFSNNNFNNLGNQANIATTQITSTNPTTQYRSKTKYTEEQNQPRQVQSSQYTIIPSHQLYSSRLQTADNTQTNLNNQVYSGQLYQWPVPDVTDQIYNRPISAELLSSQQQNTLMNQQSGNLINAPSNYQHNPNFEVVKAKTIPFNPAKLHLEPPSAPTPFTSQETLNLLNADNGISAHLQDNIVGTIAHPSDVNKRVTYKKDQSYYIYTKLEDNTIEQNIPRSAQSNNAQQNAKLTLGNGQNDFHQSFELVPSVSYELDDEKEQEKILNAFHIDEFGAPRKITTNNAGENINERKDVSANVEFSVENQAPDKQIGQDRINALYDGPSSYSAPQSSIGSLEGLEARQAVKNNFNSRLEELDNNSDGYPKEKPAQEFTF